MRSPDMEIIEIYQLVSAYYMGPSWSGSACLDFGIMRDGTDTWLFGRHRDFPNAVRVLFHRITQSVPFVLIEYRAHQ